MSQCIQNECKAWGKTAQNEGHCVEWKGAETYFTIGLPKWLIQVLKRRKYHEGMKLDKIRAELTSHTDFKEEKTKI